MRSHIKITKTYTTTTDQYTNAVVKVEWAKAAISDDGIKAAVLRESTFDPEKITGSFIPFAELTEAIVLSWVQAEYDENAEQIDKMILTDMENQRKSKAVQVANLPWLQAN
jgi:hypothetical protein